MGYKFYAKDGGNLKMIDPSDFSVKSVVGAVERTLGERFADAINVKDFGAKGDGTTDDTAAIQMALFIGRNIFFPTGVYRCSGGLSLTNKNGVSIQGCGCDEWDFPSHPMTRKLGTGGSTLLFYGTGEKTHSLPGITSCYTAQDPDETKLKYSLLDLSAQFSCGLYVENCQGFNISGLRIQVNFNGVDGYNDANTTSLGDAWDVGLALVNCAFYSVRNVQSVGYWRKAGTLLANCRMATGLAQGTFGVVDHVYTQGFRGLAIRADDDRETTTNVGIAGTVVQNSAVLDLAHRSRLSALPLGFETAAAALEISGDIMRDVDFINTHFFGADCIALLNDCDDMGFISCFAEPFGRKEKIDGDFLDRGARFIATEKTVNLSFDVSTEFNSFVDFSPYNRSTSQKRYSADGLYAPKSHLFFAMHHGVVGSAPIAPVSTDSFTTLFMSPRANSSGKKGLRVVDNTYTVKMAVTSDGALGLNTSTPATLLHVYSPYENATENAAITITAPGFASIQFRSVGDSLDWGRLRNDGSNFSLGWSTGQTSAYSNYYGWSKYSFRPLKDGEIFLGTSSNRWSQLFAATATINTSDARCKENIAAPDDALMRAWGKVGFKVFQFKDAVEKKGGDARIHVGVIAQEVKAAFESEGLDASRYGLFCHDAWEDEYEDVTVVDQSEVTDDDGNITTPEVSHTEKKLVTAAGDRYGIRYEEALALECAYQRWRLAQLEAKLS